MDESCSTNSWKKNWSCGHFDSYHKWERSSMCSKKFSNLSNLSVSSSWIQILFWNWCTETFDGFLWISKSSHLYSSKHNSPCFPTHKKQLVTADNASADPQKYFLQLPNDIFSYLCTLKSSLSDEHPKTALSKQLSQLSKTLIVSCHLSSLVCSSHNPFNKHPE